MRTPTRITIALTSTALLLTAACGGSSHDTATSTPVTVTAAAGVYGTATTTADVHNTAKFHQFTADAKAFNAKYSAELDTLGLPQINTAGDNAVDGNATRLTLDDQTAIALGYGPLFKAHGHEVWTFLEDFNHLADEAIALGL